MPQVLDQCKCNAGVKDSIMDSAEIFSDLESISSHTILIFVHQTLAIFLRIVRAREQHAFVSCGFFIFADTAGLSKWESELVIVLVWIMVG